MILTHATDVTVATGIPQGAILISSACFGHSWVVRLLLWRAEPVFFFSYLNKLCLYESNESQPRLSRSQEARIFSMLASMCSGFFSSCWCIVREGKRMFSFTDWPPRITVFLILSLSQCTCTEHDTRPCTKISPESGELFFFYMSLVSFMIEDSRRNNHYLHIAYVPGNWAAGERWSPMPSL